MLDGFHTKFPPGERFSYCNGGYVVLALIAERASACRSTSWSCNVCASPPGWWTRRSCAPTSSRAATALGYLDVDGDRTNVFHLPVRGAGDGGIFTTAADVSRALDGLVRRTDRLDGPRRPDGAAPQRRPVPTNRPVTAWGSGSAASGDVVELHGYGRGVSFQTDHDRTTGLTSTVLSNTSEGAWPIVEHLHGLFES